ncbi:MULTISPECIES: tyrosine-protein phosphatase [Ramlibacter]|uniref:Tyrosine-protein phosphatase n=1 Tax=Ramlibacter aquaticus TaxID=2780094 RepID=A0ABR9S9L9_9BURK|nr:MULTISPECIES: tyrosine-protein phosphatase [Ramlibacter]MBE7939018.1 tyrosine-protein phosphatase [Ramlibacter aquaticus]
MQPRQVELPPHVPGSLWLAGMPARLEPWADFVARLEDRNIQTLLCLTPREELAELSPAYATAVRQGTLPCRWWLSPIPNFGVPRDRDAFRKAVADVATLLRNGEGVLLHCAAGMGRTGSAAACVLKALGLDTQDALRRVREAGSNPQNAVQSGFVDWF